MRTESFGPNHFSRLTSFVSTKTRRLLLETAERLYFSLRYFDPYPIRSIAIELSTACNRRCPYCPTGNYPEKQFLMEKDTLDLVLTQISDLCFNGIIGIVRYGEPLLIPDLDSKIRHIKTRLPKCTIEVATNGDLLTTARCGQLVAAGVGLVTVSRHPPFSDDWDRRICEVKHMYPAQVHVPLVGGGLGGDLWQTRGGLVKNLPGQNQNAKRCYATQWTVITIHAQVLLCCGDFFRANVMGDLHTESLSNIYYSPRFAKLRTQLRKGIFELPICKACSQTK
jgi:hypothetical protein